MLELLLSIPKDIVRGNIVSCLDLRSLSRLDVAAASHEHRQNILDHIISGAEIDETIEHSQEAVRWLLARGVDVEGMIFRAHIEDADLDAASSVFTKHCSIFFYGCTKLSEKAVQSFFRECNWLSVLGVDGCTWLTDNMLRVVAEHHTYLFELTFSNAPLITDEGAAHLASCCSDLGKIHIKNCALLGDVFIRQLGRCDVFGLNLTDCPNTSEEALLEFIAETGDNLTYFSISDNLRVTFKTLQALARFCPLLEVLMVDGCQNIDDAGFITLFPACQQLTYFSAYNCTFSAAALDMMSATISTRMRHLCISECDVFNDQHIEQITARAANIDELHIGYCPLLTNRALIYIGNRLPCLEELRVQAGILLSYSGFASVAHGCPNLRSLDVTFCEHFDNNSLREIAKHCTQLSELALSDIKCMTAVSMSLIAKYCPNLEDIDIGFTSVTEAAVTHLITSCPKLTSIAWESQASVGDALQELVTQRKIKLALADEDEEEDG